MKPILFLAASIASGILAVGCTTAPTTVSARADLHGDVNSALARLYDADPSLQNFLHNADAYVIFPDAGKAGVVVGGAYGRGEVYDQGRFVGYADISQATIGAQLGGQGFTELVAFETSAALTRFEGGQFTFDANASAVAMKSGAAASARYTHGVAVFVQPIGGLMAEADIGGQTFSFQPASHPEYQTNGLAGADETP